MMRALSESNPGQKHVVWLVADFFLRPPTLKASNFEALWPTDPISPVWKDGNAFEQYTTSWTSYWFLGYFFLSQSDPTSIGHKHTSVIVHRYVRKTSYDLQKLRLWHKKFFKGKWILVAFWREQLNWPLEALGMLFAYTSLHKKRRTYIYSLLVHTF